MKKNFEFNKLCRRMKWFVFNSRVIILGLEHFLAMFPATILVALIVNNTFEKTIIDIALVLFTSGIGTIAFVGFSRGKIPAYAGSSFAYIGVTIYLLNTQMKNGIIPEMAYVYVGWAYIFSGILLIFLSYLYNKKKIEKVLSFLLPATVIGPAISLIGLELADAAIVDSGFDVVNGLVDVNSAYVAVSTLFAIIIFSLLKNKLLKNSAIIMGMILGIIIFCLINGFSTLNINAKIYDFDIPPISFPIMYFPDDVLTLVIAVIPATFVVFTENLSRVTVINGMMNNEKYELGIFNQYSIKKLKLGLYCHGIASIIVTFLGSVPNTLYAENIAVMGIHKTEEKEDPDAVICALTKPFSCIPYVIAAIMAIIASFSRILQEILINIPKPVIGGMELFLFGIISAPGIQLLVNQRVNYKKVSNQIITAAVLISGVSGLVVNLGVIELKGMSLGFVVGVILNLLVNLLKLFGNLGDEICFDEVLTGCLEAFLKNKKENNTIITVSTGSQSYYIEDKQLYNALTRNIPEIQVKSKSGTQEMMSISTEFIGEFIKHSDKAVFDENLIVITKTFNSIYIKFNKKKLNKDICTQYLNDYPQIIDMNDEYLQVDILKGIPVKKVYKLIDILNRE